MKNLISAFILFSIFSLSCNDEKPKSAILKETPKLLKTSLRQEWFPYSGYAGELFATNVTDSLYGLDLTLHAGADDIDPVKMVLGGTDEFGIASADRILTANSKGANLVVIGVANYISPTCFIAKAEKNVKSPKDFEGKKVGILTGTNTEYIYKYMVKKLGLKIEAKNEIEVPFDLATFIAGSYDIRPGFIYDEPVSLDLKGIKYSVVEPKDYGVHFLGTVYFTTLEMITKEPQKVQAFVNAVADGWKQALVNPEAAISYLQKFDPSIDANRELLSLKKGIPYFSGQSGKILYAEMSEWEGMVGILKELGAIKDVDLTQTVNYSFINYYLKNNSK